jgi:hypothetical protein
VAFKAERATASHGRTGFLLTSKDGTKLNRAGAAAFVERTSRDPGDALGRSYTGGATDAHPGMRPIWPRPIAPRSVFHGMDTRRPQANRANARRSR